jgi:hypothetical protein
LNHLKNVNQWTFEEAISHVNASFKIFHQYQETKGKWSTDNTNFINSIPYKKWLSSNNVNQDNLQIKFGSFCLLRRDHYNIHPKPRRKIIKTHSSD